MVHIAIFAELAPETATSREVESQCKTVVNRVGTVVADIRREACSRQVFALKRQTKPETERLERFVIALCKSSQAANRQDGN